MDYTPYIAALRAKAEAEHWQREERRARALRAAQEMADLLRRDYGVTRVVLSGSLARGGLFHAHSDIDLAVWGLDPPRYHSIHGRLLGMVPEFGVDLVEFEDARPRLQATIEAEGVEL